MVCNTVHMRWDELFSDLEAQLDAELDDADLDDDVEETRAAEAARVSLGARLRAQRGTAVVAHTRDGAIYRGQIGDSGEEWVVLTAGARNTLIPLNAVTSLEGLTRAQVAAGAVESRVGLGHALRAIAESEADVAVVIDGVSVHATIAAVGRDHLELVSSANGQVLVSPFAALISVAIG